MTRIIMFSGFMQKLVPGLTGLEELKVKLAEHDPYLLTWRVNIETLLKVWSPPNVLIGYSWGGATAIQLCHRYDKAGKDIDLLLLCDAVYRSPRKACYFKSFLKQRDLYVPKNVKQVQVWRQERGRPYGSRIHYSPPTTPVAPVTIVKSLKHAKMDSYEPFHEQTIKLCSELTKSLPWG